MEHEFDKEIDAILRRARRDGPVLVGDARHLDADEISAFAENAMPEKSRSLYAAHMADCDRCRKILSNVLIMNSEAAPVAVESPSVITIAERSLPWYSKLFTFPNLAYVMGSLVLIFGGFLAFSIFQNSGATESAKISEPMTAEKAASEGGPRFQSEELAEMNSNASANTMANAAAANVAMPPNSNAASSAGTGPGGPRENSYVLDGTSSTDTATSGYVAPPPPPVTAAAAQPQDRDKDARADDVALAAPKSEAKADEALKESTRNSTLMKQQAGVPTQSGPMRNSENQYRVQLENQDRRAAKVARGADEESANVRKVVAGRTFERKDGVWYDTNYQGHPTINVRRGSDEFKRLDAGLRSIANSMSGTIVVVWGAKAYRIQ